jgi:hypothetical protein
MKENVLSMPLLFGPSNGGKTSPTVKRRTTMIRLIAVAGFVLTVATSAQAMTPVPIPQPDGMITQTAAGCGPGRTRINGVCVARTTIRQTRRAVRRNY